MVNPCLTQNPTAQRYKTQARRGSPRDAASVRSGSVSTAAQLDDGAAHGFTRVLVVLNEGIGAEDSRNFGSVAILLDQPHGGAIYVCRRKQGKVLPPLREGVRYRAKAVISSQFTQPQGSASGVALGLDRVPCGLRARRGEADCQAACVFAIALVARGGSRHSRRQPLNLPTYRAGARGLNPNERSLRRP